MEKQKKILDASILIKIFTHEDNSEKAISIIEDYESGKTNIIVPEIIFIEVLNGLKYKKQTEEILIKANKELWNLEFKIEQLNYDLLVKALEIALKNDLTMYDALYIAIAQLHSCPLITADKELYKISNVIPLEKT